MALTKVGTSTTNWQEDVNSVTISRTVTAGSTGLIVKLVYYNGSGTVTISSANWNTSEAFTSVITSANTGGDYRAAILRLVNPTSGTHDVVVNFTGQVYVRTTIDEYSNLDTATPTHDASAANGDSVTATVDVASVVAGEIVVDACTAGQALTAGAGQTTDQNGVLVTAAALSGATGFDNTSTGTVTTSYSVSGGSLWAICALALKEGSSGGPAVTWVGYIG